MNKLDFKLVTLKNQKPLKTKHAYLELFDDHMFYRLDFLAEEWNDPEDEMLGKKEVPNYFDTMVMKANIAAIEMVRTSEEFELWRVMIAISGVGEDLKIYFDKKEDAEEFRKKLIDWKLKK